MTPIKIVETGEAFLLLSRLCDPLPETFWERSHDYKTGRTAKLSCHASAWNLDGQDDIRIKMCTKVNADDFQTVHHELGHNYYQRAYQRPVTRQSFRRGANGGFHEAIGDMVRCRSRRTYLKTIGLLG